MVERKKKSRELGVAGKYPAKDDDDDDAIFISILIFSGLLCWCLGLHIIIARIC